MSFLENHSSSITLLSDIGTAFGTVGAVIVALWLGYQDSRPKLKVNATVETSSPGEPEYLRLSCSNVSKQNITCENFMLTPNRFIKLREGKRRDMLIPGYRIPGQLERLPKYLRYSEKIDILFEDDLFKEGEIKKSLNKSKWAAKLQLKFIWRVIAITNIKEFSGKLPKKTIEKIINSVFS